jgi:hypothetical protein
MKKGIHYFSLYSELDDQSTHFVLDAVWESSLLDLLERYPLGRLELVQEMNTGDPILDSLIDGYTLSPEYTDYPSITIRVVRKIPKGKETLSHHRAGYVPNVDLIDTPLNYMRGILIHELGHHLIYQNQTLLSDHLRSAFARAKPISRYAAENWEEYFCESLVAWVYHSDILKQYDGVGHQMVGDVLAILRG